MDQAFDSAENAQGSSNRRSHPRKTVESMIYIEVNESNGGIIVNISEGGLAVQAAMPLVDDHFPCVRFRLSKSEDWISGRAVIAWKDESKKRAGIKFVDLSEESRAQIRAWISSEAPGAQTLPRVGTPPIPGDSVRTSQDRYDSRPENGVRSVQSAPVDAPQDFRRLNGSGSHRIKVSRTRLKRYLVDERHRIRLYDLVSDNTEKLCSELTKKNFPTTVPVTDREFLRRIHRYEELTEELLSIIITGCFWGEKNQELIWAKLLERVANAAGARDGLHQWVSLQSYPALLLLHAGGVAAIANEKFSTLEAILVKPMLIGPDGDSRLVDRLSAATVIEDERLTRLLPGGELNQAPLSSYLCGFLRERFREFVPSDDVYDEIFDHFEYMFSLVWIDENPIGASLGWVPLGRFAWRHLTGPQSGASIVGRIGAEVSQQGKDWPAFRAGLFGGSMQRFVSARNRVATFMGSQR
jgi:hypothetical protein